MVQRVLGLHSRGCVPCASCWLLFWVCSPCEVSAAVVAPSPVGIDSHRNLHVTCILCLPELLFLQSAGWCNCVVLLVPSSPALRFHTAEAECLLNVVAASSFTATIKVSCLLAPLNGDHPWRCNAPQYTLCCILCCAQHLVMAVGI